MGINPGGECSERCSDNNEDEDDNIDSSTDLVPLPTTDELLQP